MTHVFDPESVLTTRPQALAAGMDDDALARLVRAGVIRRIRTGAYAAADAWDPLPPVDRHRVLARAVVAKAGTRVALSHITAAVEHGAPTWGLPLDDIHITRTDRRAGRREAGVCQHRGRLLESDIHAREQILVTSPTKTALDITTIASLEQSLCVVNDLLHRGLTDIGKLAARYELMMQDPHTLRTEMVLRLADPRLASVGESRTYALLWRNSLPAPTLQYAVASDGHTFAYLDFAWPELGRWIEFDGLEKYVKFLRPGETAADAVIREKRREDRVREVTGWRCLRITWAELADPVRLAMRVRAFLGLAPTSGDVSRRLA
jgi:hypothetical protein